MIESDRARQNIPKKLDLSCFLKCKQALSW